MPTSRRPALGSKFEDVRVRMSSTDVRFERLDEKLNGLWFRFFFGQKSNRNVGRSASSGDEYTSLVSAEILRNGGPVFCGVAHGDAVIESGA